MLSIFIVITVVYIIIIFIIKGISYESRINTPHFNVWFPVL